MSSAEDQNTALEKLLASYTASALEEVKARLDKARESGREHILRAKAARNAMGQHTHDFEGMLQRFEGLFAELTGNVEEVEAAIAAGAGEKQMEILCARADPLQFLAEKTHQYDMLFRRRSTPQQAADVTHPRSAEVEAQAALDGVRGALNIRVEDLQKKKDELGK